MGSKVKIMAFLEVTVKNKKGTSDKEPPDGSDSWLDFWKNKKNKKTVHGCKVIGCNGEAKNGGHVIKKGNKEYILPICDSCNLAPDGTEFKAYETDLVPVHDDDD